MRGILRKPAIVFKDCSILLTFHGCKIQRQEIAAF